MNIQETAAPNSTLLGRKIVVALLLMWWLAAQFATYIIGPTYETIVAAMNTSSPSDPYTSSNHDEWNAERKRLGEERRKLLE